MENDVPKPKHIAFVMDGNRRWATERGLPKMLGHTEGAKTMKQIVIHASKLGIPYLTFWALSTENIKERSESELKHLFSLFVELVNYISDLDEQGVKVKVIGNMLALPVEVQQALNTMVEKTSHNTKLTLILAVNYGGRDELVRSVKRLMISQIKPEEVDEEIFGSFLDTASIPDTDLIIRTGGKYRLSGFLPWQSVYAEMYFSDILWPAFDVSAFDIALKWYSLVERNFGK